MNFSEQLKLNIRKKAHHKCCLCRDKGVIGILEIHHIIPQAENGPDTEENAAPLCPTCHDIYGDNPRKRKMLRELRDSWYEICEKREKPNPIITDEDLELRIRKIIEKENSEKHFSKFSQLKQKIKNLLQPSSVEITYAKLSIKKNDFVKATEYLEKEIKQNPQSDIGYYLLGYVSGEQEQFERMLEYYHKSIEISNKFLKSIRKSKSYHWADNFNKGVKLFNSAIKDENESSAKTIFQQAVDKFKIAIECQPDEVDTYWNLAYSYINQGEIDAAIVSFKKIVDLTNSAESYAQLGEIYLQKGLEVKVSGNKEKEMEYFNEAIGVLGKGRKAHPTNGDILLLLSNSYIAANKLDVAKIAFKDGVIQEPQNKFYRYNYGSLLLTAEEFPEAEIQLKKAVELDGEYENALYNLAVTYVKWGAKIREDMESKGDETDTYNAKFEAALPLLEKYLTLKENESSVWDLLGKVYANLGMSDKSKDAFEKADSVFEK